MSDTPTLADLADRFALDLREGDGARAVQRHGFEVNLPDAIVDELDPTTPRGRHLAFAVFFGIRLAIDRTASDFDVANERPEKPEQVFHAHEIPSVYGERLPRLVPRLTIAWFEALTGDAPLSTDWLVEELRFVYILETGKHLHTLCESDLGQMSLSREKLLRDARHALFYEAYKLKPKDEERTEDGRVRIFRTVEGLGATRAMLLPDYDYDAARESGCFSTPSRDTMIIGRPASKNGADNIRKRVEELTANLVESEPFPLCSRVGELTTDRAHSGEHVGDLRLPMPHDEVLAAARPPEDTALEQIMSDG